MAKNRIKVVLRGKKKIGAELPHEWIMTVDGVKNKTYYNRRYAIFEARSWCRLLRKHGYELQLKVFNIGNGRISFENTYGNDPKRYRG